MIVTVTMNPAIDKTIDVDKIKIGGLNRIKKTEIDVGGKGINVSKTLIELKEESIATGFIGGSTGQEIEKYLNLKGIKTDFVLVDGQTRTNTKVYEENGELTELNELGPIISRDKQEELINKLVSYASEKTLFVLAGSVPRGIDKDIYKIIIEKVHEKKAVVLMDADGELFVKGLEANPDMIKPNRIELQEYLHFDYRASEDEIINSGKMLQKKGIKEIMISMGQGGAIYFKDNYIAKAKSLKVKAHSTVGAGDAMVAGMAYSWENNLSENETFKTCIAVSAGAVTTTGTKPPTKELVTLLKTKVEVETISK